MQGTKQNHTYTAYELIHQVNVGFIGIYPLFDLSRPLFNTVNAVMYVWI